MGMPERFHIRHFEKDQAGLRKQVDSRNGKAQPGTEDRKIGDKKKADKRLRTDFPVPDFPVPLRPSFCPHRLASEGNWL